MSWKDFKRELSLRLSVKGAWRMIEERKDGAMFMHRIIPLKVIVSINPYTEQCWINATESSSHKRTWIHASISHETRMPEYEELKMLHNMFIGSERFAYQLFVPTAKHVNCHPRCLHLWARLDGEAVTPDFTQGTGML